MDNKNYHCEIEINKTSDIAFSAVTERISEWWAKNIKGSSSGIHDVFTVYFGKTSGTFKIVDLVPNKRIVWYTINCYLDIFENKELWKHSTLVWEFIQLGHSVKIKMTHIGLFTGLECYNDCKLGWDFYVKESLYKLLTENKGLPGTGIRARIVNGDRIYEGVMYSIEDPIPRVSDNYLIIDIKEASGEQIISAYNITRKDKEIFKTNNLKGNYYLILENKPIREGILPLKDLQYFFNL